MIHFIYLVLFALFVAVAFAIFAKGTTQDRLKLGFKTFGQFVIIGLALAWIFYFIP